MSEVELRYCCAFCDRYDASGLSLNSYQRLQEHIAGSHPAVPKTHYTGKGKSQAYLCTFVDGKKCSAAQPEKVRISGLQFVSSLSSYHQAAVWSRSRSAEEITHRLRGQLAGKADPLSGCRVWTPCPGLCLGAPR